MDQWLTRICLLLQLERKNLSCLKKKEKKKSKTYLLFGIKVLKEICSTLQFNIKFVFIKLKK